MHGDTTAVRADIGDGCQNVQVEVFTQLWSGKLMCRRSHAAGFGMSGTVRTARVSSESTNVREYPPQVCIPVQDTGLSSSIGKAWLT